MTAALAPGRHFDLCRAAALLGVTTCLVWHTTQPTTTVSLSRAAQAVEPFRFRYPLGSMRHGLDMLFLATRELL